MKRKSQLLSFVPGAKASPTIRSASPGFRLLRWPARYATVSSLPGRRASAIHGRIAFQAGRAVSSRSAVSKVCGFSSGPGMLCTFKPMSSDTCAGTPVIKLPGSGDSFGGGVGGVSRVKASQVSAATPGRKR